MLENLSGKNSNGQTPGHEMSLVIGPTEVAGSQAVA